MGWNTALMAAFGPEGILIVIISLTAHPFQILLTFVNPLPIQGSEPWLPSAHRALVAILARL